MTAPISILHAARASLIAALCTATVAAQPLSPASAAPDEIYVTRFDDVIAMVAQSDESVQARFAEIALTLMIDAFGSELEATSRSSGSGENGDGWRSGTRGYVEQLKRIGESVQVGTSIRIMQEQQGGVRLVIGREQLMLHSPRAETQGRFEQSIAESVCRFVDCSSRPPTIEERSIARTAKLDSAWTFAHNEPPSYVSSDGLRCIFDDQRHLKLKKEACLAVMGEIRLLTEALAALHVHHKPIDWDRIQIAHVGASAAQKVVYSGRGDFVRVSLPQLLRAESVWRSALPWVRATVLGQSVQHVINLPNQIAYQAATVKGDYEIN